MSEDGDDPYDLREREFEQANEYPDDGDPLADDDVADSLGDEDTTESTESHRTRQENPIMNDTNTTALASRAPTPLSIVPSALGEMSVQAIIDRKRKIVEVMEAVMKEGEHFGRIPGCGDKPTLYKAGAEVLCTVFRLVPKFLVLEKDLGNDHREYRVKCVLEFNREPIAECDGICSTKESKYRWRKKFTDRKCPSCEQPTILKSKEKPEWFCWRKKGGCGATFDVNDPAVADQVVGESKIENPDIADVYNTVLKMAIKRAQVGATLIGVGASDILTQDLEDLPAGSIANNNAPAAAASEPVEERASNESRPVSKLAGVVLALIADLGMCRTRAEMQRLVPRFNDLPKGSRERSEAFEAWRAREVDIERREKAQASA